MTWVILNVLGVVALAGGELTQQHLLNLKNAYSERTRAVLTFLFQSLLTIPFILLLGYGSQLFSIFVPITLIKIIAVTFLSSIAMIFYLRSFKVKNISFSTIFASVSVPIATFLGIVFFNESTSLTKFLGIVLILLSIISLNLRNTSLEKNHFFGLLAGVMFGVAYTLDKSILQTVSPLIYIFWAFFLVSFWGFLLIPKQVIKSVKNRPSSALIPIAISGIGYFFYNFFTFNAYKLGGEVGRVD